MKRRVFVTGASGFIGRHLCSALEGRGDLVVRLVRDHVLDDADLPITVRGDLSLPLLERVIAEYEIDLVIHLAAQVQVSVAKADPVGTLESNVRGTWNLLEACRRQKVRRIVIASSDKSFGDGVVPYREEQPLVAHNIYATSKAASDLIAQSYEREYCMSIVITRCGNVYGPGNFNRSTIIGGSILSVLDGRAPTIRSDGTPRRDYLYADDAVSGYLALADSDYIGPMNFGTGKPTSALDVVTSILSIMESDFVPIIEGGARSEIRDQWLDVARAKRVLNWEANVSLKDGLTQTVKWYQSNYHRTRKP